MEEIDSRRIVTSDTEAIYEQADTAMWQGGTRQSLDPQPNLPVQAGRPHGMDRVGNCLEQREQSVQRRWRKTKVSAAAGQAELEVLKCIGLHSASLPSCLCDILSHANPSLPRNERTAVQGDRHPKADKPLSTKT